MYLDNEMKIPITNKIYWDTNIESEIQIPIINKMGFMVNIPSKSQFKEILKLTHLDKGIHNICDFLSISDIEDYTEFSNVKGGEKDSQIQLYIITHPQIYSFDNGSIYYHVLGMFILNFPNDIFLLPSVSLEFSSIV